MKIIWIFLLCFAIISNSVDGKTICYDDYGCFSDDDNDFRFPEEPTKIATAFYLFNRANENTRELISRDSIASFQKDLLTKFIIHGFKGNSSKSWMLEMKNEILKAENVNVILVDWGKGNDHPYSKAAGNTQIVGIDVSKLIVHLMNEKNIKAESFHLIGYSLGAQISAIAGSKIPNLGRITGLDPSGLYYSDASNRLKLDKSDAEFVDVIHTDGSRRIGMGTRDRMGHADFYPNGGKDQPGCSRSNTKILTSAWSWLTASDKKANQEFACSHRASRVLFIDSIDKKCKYTAYGCDDLSNFREGKCIECGANGCNQMGYWASKSNQLGKLFLKTKPLNLDGSYCLKHFQVRMVSNGLKEQSKAKGEFRIYWKTADYVSPTMLIKDETIELIPNMETKFLYTLNEQSDEPITEVDISYKRTSKFLVKYFYDKNWSIKYVEIYSGDTQESIRFCPVLQMIQSGATNVFKKCLE